MSQQQQSNLRQDIHWDKVEYYIRRNIPEVQGSKLEVEKFSAGYSNLTYLIRIGEWEAVLRRPPFGPIPPKAHDMEREYRILEKINPLFSLAPKPYLFCENPEIMDRHFYIMENKKGVVIDDSLPNVYENTTKTRKVISEAVVDTLVKLHFINYKEANLTNIGRPDGYLERQVHGWIKRYHNSKTDDIEGVDSLETWLVNHIPSSPDPTIVHNDYKLNNMMFSSDNPSKVVGVFDWEMCTIGDPLTDVGSALAYWTEDGEIDNGLRSVTEEPGFYSRKEFLEMYAKNSGRDLEQIDYYLTFAFYKIAVILQQIYYRWKTGSASDDRFATLGGGVKNLMKQGFKAQQKEIIK